MLMHTAGAHERDFDAEAKKDARLGDCVSAAFRKAQGECAARECRGAVAACAARLCDVSVSGDG